MPQKTRKTPMRMCVGCREMKPKKELVRIVRSPQGEVAVDATGKAAGRGAYLCDDPACLAKAKKTRALSRALDHPIEEPVWQEMEQALTRLREARQKAEQATGTADEHE